MLDIPKLGLALLNGAISHVAEVAEDSETLESAISVLETCKGLVNPSELKQALTHTATTSKERLQKEKDVQRSLMEAHEIRRMF